MNTMRIRRGLILSAAVAGAVASSRALAQDQLSTVVSNSNAIASGTSLATFGYDPVNDRMYVASNFNANQSIRLINNVGDTQTVQTQIGETAWRLFEEGGK